MNKKQKQIIKEWRKISNKLIFIKNKNKEVDEYLEQRGNNNNAKKRSK